MKQLLIPAIALFTLITGCTSKCIEDSGNHIENSTVVKNFDKIEVTGALKIVLRQDSTYGVKVAADSNVISSIKMDVSSSQLKISMKDGAYCGTDSIVVQVGIGELKELKTDGAVNLHTAGPIYADDVVLKLSGSSDINLMLNARKVTTQLEGAGKLTLSGQAGELKLSTQGVATIEAFNFTAGVCLLDFTGTAKANINVLNELTVKTEGSSEVYYKGNPKKVDEKKSGAAKLEKVN